MRDAMLVGNGPGLSCPDHAPAGLGSYAQLPAAECSLDNKRGVFSSFLLRSGSAFPGRVCELVLMHTCF